MAVAFVQADSDAGEEGIGVTSLTITVSSVAAGNTLVTCTGIFDSDGVAPTGFGVDDGTNTYTSGRGQTFGADSSNDGCRLEIHGTTGGTAAGNFDVVVTPGDTVTITVGVMEFSGVDLTTPFGTGAGTQASSNAPSTGAITPNADGIIVAHASYDSSPRTITPNWTDADERLEIDENNDACDQNILTKACTNAVADTAAWTLSASVRWGAQGIPLRAAAAAASLPRFRRSWRNLVTR